MGDRGEGLGDRVCINFSELCELMRGKMIDKADRAEIDRMFELLDTDSKGNISFRDLKRVSKEIGNSLTDTQIQDLLEEADRDGDGYIDSDEFYKVMLLGGKNPP